MIKFEPDTLLPSDDQIERTYNEFIVEKSRETREAYINACLSRSLAEFPYLNATTAKVAVARLDRAIITAGDQAEILLDLIQKIQSKHLPMPRQPSDILFVSNHEQVHAVSTSTKSVPRLSGLPSFSSFLANGPFILPGYCLDWPAVGNWKSKEYLRLAAGSGRIVPVEVGHDYRTSDWTQKLMDWDDFLDSLNSPTHPLLYLAQHSLFMQFPRLRNDIVIPDYVYAAPDHSKDFPDYRPPANEDQLVINAWLGPKGTVSPAHTDPYYNFYAQVVGRKTVWLAPSRHTKSMYPYNSSTEVTSPESIMNNTTQVDVFGLSDGKFPDFWEEVVPEAMSATLEPGDLLFFPPGWWHAFRSEDVSFSVSMWF